MTTQTFSLIDVNATTDKLVDAISADNLSLSGARNWSINKRTLHGGCSEGVDVVEVDNGALTLALLPTRGMGIWKGEYAGQRLGWDSPVKQPVHPTFVNLADRNGLGWLNGFNELLCRCGLSSNGAPGEDSDGHPLENPLPLHGRIANLPAQHVSATIDDTNNGTLSITGIVTEAGLFTPQLQLKSTLRTMAGSNKFTIEDEVTNLSSQPADFQLLYHTNLGSPFLEAGSQCIMPVREFAPRNARAAEGVENWHTFNSPEAGYAEQVYFFDLASDDNQQSTVLLKNAAGDLGISMEINQQQLPYFILWKNTQDERDGYCVGMEPATNFPNHRSFERQQGRVIRLNADESYCTSFSLAVHTSIAEVQSVEQHISELQKNCPPILHTEPTDNWSPADV